MAVDTYEIDEAKMSRLLENEEEINNIVENGVNLDNQYLLSYLNALTKIENGLYVNYHIVGFLDSIGGFPMVTVGPRISGALGVEWNYDLQPDLGISGGFNFRVQAWLNHELLTGSMVELTGQYDRWLTGSITKIYSGSTNRVNIGGGNLTFTKISIGYLVTTGGGTIQMYAADVAVGSPVDTSVGIVGEIKFIEYVQATPAKTKVHYTVTGGDIEIAYQYYENTAKTDMYYHSLSRGGLNISDAMSGTIARSNLGKVLNRIQPQLITYESKEEPNTMTENFYKLCDIIDTNITSVDVLVCGSTPIVNSDNIQTLGQIIQNDHLEETVRSRRLAGKNYLYVNKMLPYSPKGNVYKSYEYAKSLGTEYYGDGVHFAYKGTVLGNQPIEKLLNDTETYLGFSYKPVRATKNTSILRRGSGFKADQSNLTFDTDDGMGFHWYSRYLYSFYLIGVNNQKQFQISDGAGRNNILPAGYRVGSENSTSDVFFNVTDGKDAFMKLNSSTAANGKQGIEAGFLRSYYTMAQLKLIPANQYQYAFTMLTDAPGGPCLVWARGDGTQDWLRVKDDTAIVFP